MIQRKINRKTFLVASWSLTPNGTLAHKAEHSRTKTLAGRAFAGRAFAGVAFAGRAFAGVALVSMLGLVGCLPTNNRATTQSAPNVSMAFYCMNTGSGPYTSSDCNKNCSEDTCQKLTTGDKATSDIGPSNTAAKDTQKSANTTNDTNTTNSNTQNSGSTNQTKTSGTTPQTQAKPLGSPTPSGNFYCADAKTGPYTSSDCNKNCSEDSCVEQKP